MNASGWTAEESYSQKPLPVRAAIASQPRYGAFVGSGDAENLIQNARRRGAAPVLYQSVAALDEDIGD